MKSKLSVVFFPLLLASMATGATQLSPRIIEASNALIEIPLTQSKERIAIVAGDVDMIYTKELTKGDAPALLSIKNAEIMFGDMNLSSTWVLLEPGSSDLKALNLDVEYAQGMAKSGGSGGTISLRCSGGQLYKNGQPTGTYPTPNVPNKSLISNASVYCTGNILGVIFHPKTQEP